MNFRRIKHHPSRGPHKKATIFPELLIANAIAHEQTNQARLTFDVKVKCILRHRRKSIHSCTWDNFMHHTSL